MNNQEQERSDRTRPAFPDFKSHYVGLVMRKEPQRADARRLFRFGASGRMLEDLIPSKDVPQVYRQLAFHGIKVVRWDDEDYLIATKDRFPDANAFANKIYEVTRRVAGRGVLIHLPEQDL